jgi:hypothetical protein
MVNWKTTLFGVLGAVGTYLATQPGWLGTVGSVLVAVSSALLGYFAADAKPALPAP